MLFFSTGIISASRIHLYLALFLHRDYFGRPDSSLACSSVPQGLFQPTGFIPSLLFSFTGIISTCHMHPCLAFLFHRDYFSRPDASLSCALSPQGLFRPSQTHLYIALLFHRDYFSRPDASLSCAFSPQGLLGPGQMHPYLAFLRHTDYFAPVRYVPIAENISARPFRQLPICLIMK